MSRTIKMESLSRQEDRIQEERRRQRLEKVRVLLNQKNGRAAYNPFEVLKALPSNWKGKIRVSNR